MNIYCFKYAYRNPCSYIPPNVGGLKNKMHFFILKFLRNVAENLYKVVLLNFLYRSMDSIRYWFIIIFRVIERESWGVLDYGGYITTRITVSLIWFPLCYVIFVFRLQDKEKKDSCMQTTFLQRLFFSLLFSLVENLLNNNTQKIQKNTPIYILINIFRIWKNPDKQTFPEIIIIN